MGNDDDRALYSRPAILLGATLRCLLDVRGVDRPADDCGLDCTVGRRGGCCGRERGGRCSISGCHQVHCTLSDFLLLLI